MINRIVRFYLVFVTAAITVAVSLAGISLGISDLAEAAVRQSSYLLDAASVRGTIYDRNFEPMVNAELQTVAAVVPTPELLPALREAVGEEQFSELLPLLAQRKPMTVRLEHLSGLSGLETVFTVPIRYRANDPALHLIGYLNGSQGVAGLEKGYDELLSSCSGRVRLRYTVDAHGGAVNTEAQEVENSMALTAGGLVLTVDNTVQQMALDSMDKIEKGAAVVLAAGSGEVLALVSKPAYDREELAASLEREDSPFFNRALGAYNVGSVFKICVAVAALEAGYSTSYSYDCPGYYTIGEQIYRCHNLAGHGNLTMSEAFAKSCNPYFINLGQKLGAQRVWEMACAMGLGTCCKLAEGVVSAAGSLPPVNEIDEGELANLSFGQGRLTAAPVQIAQLVSCLVNDGELCSPTVILGTTDDGASVEWTDGTVRRTAFSERTAELLRGMMVDVVEEGSGYRAKPAVLTAGGKTGSAQTGTYDEQEKEVVHGWFAGFYPAENPEIIAVFFSEGGGEGGQAPAAAFAAFCDAYAEYRGLGEADKTEQSVEK